MGARERHKNRKECHLLPTAAAPKAVAGSGSTSQSGASDGGTAAAASTAKITVNASVANSRAVDLACIAVSGRPAAFYSDGIARSEARCLVGTRRFGKILWISRDDAPREPQQLASVAST